MGRLGASSAPRLEVGAAAADRARVTAASGPSIPETAARSRTGQTPVAKPEHPVEMGRWAPTSVRGYR